MVIQRFTSSPSLHFYQAGKPHAPSIQLGSYLKTIHSLAFPPERQSGF